MRNRLLLTLGLIGAVATGPLVAEDLEPAKLEFFEQRIRPILVNHCYQCHASDSEKIRGGLVVDSREGLLRGGESGPTIVPGDPEASLLLSALRHESFEMPPDRRLSAQVISDFDRWIRDGAVDPRDGDIQLPTKDLIDLEQGRQFWSFQPFRDVEVPSDPDGWASDDIDRFVLHAMRGHQLTPAKDADRETLIRRAYFALVGMPPTVEQIDAFVDDSVSTDEAFANLIDGLLQSPHFGERWGRHWLDVARYSESTGGGRSMLLPNAWRFRDYVIDSFNHDVPFDRFVVEQLAGDLLPADDWRERRRLLTATAFLLLGPTNYELQDKDVLESDIVDEQLDTLGKAFFGMTLGCARCHDHKFDPIPTRDYYAMAGILQSTRSVVHDNVSKWHTVDLPLDDAGEQQLAAHQAQVHDLEAKIKRLESVPSSLAKLIRSLPKRHSKSIVVVDDSEANPVGSWKNSQAIAGFFGDGYQFAESTEQPTDEHSFRFETQLSTAVASAGKVGNNATRDSAPNTIDRRATHEVWYSYTPGSNRPESVVVRIDHADGQSAVSIDQRAPGKVLTTVASLGRFRFEPDQPAKVTVSTKEASAGALIADGVVFLPIAAADRLAAIRKKRNLKQSQDASDDVADSSSLASEELPDLKKRLKSLRDSGPKRPVAMAVKESDSVGDIAVAIRGVVHNQGPIVPRGVLQVASHSPLKIPAEQSGRLQLAEWATSGENPLTARVIVNRVWYWLFGRGLVSTVDNFGAMGAAPSHPELLDYLAREFMADGWSIKRLIRRLMLTRTYRMSSVAQPAQQAIDPDNHWLSRMHRRRIEAECLRDTLLQLGGDLELSIGGPNIKAGTKIEYGYQFDSRRRSVYLPVFRNTLPSVFAVFDFADPNIQTGTRTESTIAPQALLLMNDALVIKQCRSAAKRLLQRPLDDNEARLERVFREVLGRRPFETEQSAALEFLQSADDLERQWGTLYQTLILSLDFRYIQ